MDGELDVLVNNAGFNGNQPLGEIDEDTYRRVVEINLTAHGCATAAVSSTSPPATRASPRRPTPSTRATKSAQNNLGLALVVRIWTSDAGRWVTGQVIDMTGGSVL